LSTPKKPGTDLAALKARLAKKNQPAQAAPVQVPAPGEVIQPPAQPPAADVPPPGQQADVPPPGQQAAPAQDIPAPGEQIPAPGEQIPAPGEQIPAPGQQIPAPGEQHVPQAQPQVAAAPPPAADPDDPFGGPGAGGFDPTDGVLDAGVEIQARGSKGLVVFAALLAAGFGAMAGWLGHKIVDTRERVEIGKKKGAEMASEVAAIADTRKSISLAMEDLEKKAAEDPAEGAKALEELLQEHFDKHPKVDALFGWQLASVHSAGIRRTFDLYEEANRLKIDLARLALHLNTHGDMLKADVGPLLFAVLFKSGGAQLVLALAPLCGEGENIDELKPCSEGGDAVAYLVQENVGSEPRRAWRGTEPDQATMLLSEGGIYQVAIGEKPERNAGVMRDQKLGRVKERLEAMAKAERIALAALENYAENPNVDGSNPPPNPEGDDE
jgi:hypothetical protein